MFEDRKGQVALVIGGTGALGSAVCELLAAEGADVAFTFRSSADTAVGLGARIEERGCRALFAPVAIEKVEEVDGFVDQAITTFGKIDTVVYASGPTIHLTFLGQIDPSEWARTMDNDINGCFHVARACLPHLRVSRGSFTAIVTGGVDRPPALDILSTAPKAAIQAMVRTMAVEEGRKGVRANCLAPGFINAGLGQKLIDELPPEQGQAILKNTPLRRMGTAQEIADGVGFLSSKRASFVTGVTLFVSGGLEL